MSTRGLAVACAAQFLIGVDGLAVAIALPDLQRDLHALPIDAQWVLTAFGLAFGGTLLLGGRLGDAYGRRRLLAVGMGVFGAAAWHRHDRPRVARRVPDHRLRGRRRRAGRAARPTTPAWSPRSRLLPAIRAAFTAAATLAALGAWISFAAAAQS
jgi:MFS family permease